MKVYNDEGYTLIELMVTVALIGVLAGLSVATWFTGLNHASLRRDARDIASALRTAKQLAITKNSPYQGYFDFTNGIYQMESCPCGVPGAVNHGTVVGTQANLNNLSFGHKPTRFIATSITSGYVQYAADGTTTVYDGGTGAQISPANPPGYVNITLGRTDGNSETKVVNVYPSGKITVP